MKEFWHTLRVALLLAAVCYCLHGCIEGCEMTSPAPNQIRSKALEPRREDFDPPKPQSTYLDKLIAETIAYGIRYRLTQP